MNTNTGLNKTCMNAIGFSSKDIIVQKIGTYIAL